MFSPITISLSPNTEKDDVLLALKLLFSPWQWKRGEYIEKLEKEFAKYLGVKHAISFNSGRTAQLAILQSLRLGKGDQVLLQAFTCVVVPNSILWTGAKPVYVDIEKNTFNINPNNLKKKINSSSRAIIVQHTFGQSAKMEKILEIAKKNNLIVIEDCAHSLGAKYKGQLTGTFGKAAFFSFGRDKVISSVFGGMAVTNDDLIGEKLKTFQEKLFYPSYFWIFQQLLHPLIFNFLVLPFYNFLSIGKIILFLFQKVNLLSFPVEKKEKLSQQPKNHSAKLPHALAILASNQLKKLERFNKKRKEIVKIYEKELKNLLVELPEIDDDSAILRYTLKTKKASKLYQFAKKRNVLLENWYACVIDPEGVDFNEIGYEAGSCPVAEKTAKQVVNLPTHPRLTKKGIRKITKLVQEFFKKR
ncbi:aminotransferase class I/II-fold pyridoxal phosphate-dependent enzyme [Candidatus Microgenomates bacterium]|nr:aminotransferase class I/II-fold pyridoxal phosphate-dependent enzyme [Candidatus Microgenomates bacterium]